MGIFGWSYPPGCSGTPYDEDSAVELESDKLPEGFTAWWDEYGAIIIQDKEGYEVPMKEALKFDWNDDLSDGMNVAAATVVLDLHLEKHDYGQV